MSASLGTPSYLLDSLYALYSFLLFILSAQKGYRERPGTGMKIAGKDGKGEGIGPLILVPWHLQVLFH